MPALIVVLSGPDKGRTFTLPDGVTTVVGRGSATATKLTDTTVSRHHCEIACAGARAELTNVSENGTKGTGEKVGRRERSHCSRVMIGNTTLRFLVSELEEAETVYQASPK